MKRDEGETVPRRKGERTMKAITRTSVILFLAVALLAACRPQEVEKPPDEVTVQLKWIHQAQFAGLYAADQKGFYADEDIEITLKPGGFDTPLDKAVTDLLDGETTFAIQGANEMIEARAGGNPIVAIAVIYQRNPWVYISLKGSGIENLQDLVGRKIMVAPQAMDQHLALLRKVGIDPSSIEIILPYERSVAPLPTGQIDAHLAYGTSFALEWEEKGYEVNRIWLDDYDIKFYSDTIIATEELVEQSPELVERFLRATLRGWRYAIENPDEAVDMTLQYDATVDIEHQARLMAAQTPLIHTGEIGIGWMDRGVWQGMLDILLEQSIIAAEDIRQKAKDVAKQMEDYIKSHPDMTLKELQEDPRAQEIAVQQIGKTGYTVVSDSTTGMCYFHPIESVVGEDVAKSREAFPEMWEHIDRTIGPICRESSYFYSWGVGDDVREQYSYYACVDAKTADGIGLFVGATTYVDEYDLAIDIDKAFTMQFLNEIYGETE